MRYKRFEDLSVWNAAIELAVAVFALTSRPQFKSQHSLRDQLERAAVSVSNNIAEGFERSTNNELLMFLYISRGSAERYVPRFAYSSACLGSAGSAMRLMLWKIKAESCSRQLKAWTQSLQNSDFKGERYVTEKLKRSDRNTPEREEFLNELLEIRKKDEASRN
ncbi:MAG: four helix bundle protein [Acidobacteriota bacterium]|nr:four helix bundle protein [Acidobacteriota bacterium]